MNIAFLQFREKLFPLGMFSTEHIRLYFSDFNTDNLLYWQKKGYIIKLRNKWYCFKEFAENVDSRLLIANQVYAPSYISHQEALMFYGLIPEHIVNSTSVTTKKTAAFEILGRTYRYYSVKRELFFGYKLIDVSICGVTRKLHIAEKEKALLDVLYFYSFYKTIEDMENLRLNEFIMEREFDWEKMDEYGRRFNSKTLYTKIHLLKKLYHND
ncbi:MAG TPA: hypothetical protein PLP11_00355 [Bacteroidales bacterium]|nr:hypothetical protein [Bacteroidales bacterium]